MVGTSLPDFWRRHFLRPVADAELAAALRTVDEQTTFEASPTPPPGRPADPRSRTLQLRTVDDTDGTVTVLVTDISEFVDMQGQLMRSLAHERFLHLVSCDLINAGVHDPKQVVGSVINALATYFNLTMAAILAPPTAVDGDANLLAYASCTGSQVDDFAALLADLGFSRPAHSKLAQRRSVISLDTRTDMWHVMLTSDQSRRLGTDNHDAVCVRTTMTGAPIESAQQELHLVALSTIDEPDAIDQEVFHKALTQIAHFMGTSLTDPSTSNTTASSELRLYERIAAPHADDANATAAANSKAANGVSARDLKQAIENHNLVVHYQPEFDLTSRRMVGAEALVRWDHPTHGLLPAGAFVPLAEQLGLSGELSNQVLTQACTAAAGWLINRPGHDPTDFTLRVNLSPRDVEDPAIVNRVFSAVERSGIPPRALCLEVTESAVMHDHSAALRHLHAFADAGISLAIDDFGTGYSSMWLLRELPFDTLKIDQIFVRSVASGRPEDRAIIETMVSLGHAFDMTITAEGIETSAQLDELLAIGVNIGQGFLLAQPGPGTAVTNALTASADHGEPDTP